MAAGDDREKKPDPVEDLKKGLGLLFRAAKGAVDQLPTDKLEDVVKSGAREVGRAIENVTETIEKEMFGTPSKKKAEKAGPAGSSAASPSAPNPATTDGAGVPSTTAASSKAPSDNLPKGDGA